MSVLDDLMFEINNYPVENVDISITDHRGVNLPGDPAGGHLNVNEVWSFSVVVYNKRHLNLNNVVVHVAGSHWTTVAYWYYHDSVFAPTAKSAPKDVPAHQTVKFEPFYVRGDEATAPEDGDRKREDVIFAHIHSYDADLSNILTGHNMAYMEHGKDEFPVASTRWHVHPIRDKVD